MKRNFTREFELEIQPPSKVDKEILKQQKELLDLQARLTFIMKG